MFSHQAFAQELGGLPFELIGDYEHKLATAYGVARDDLAGYAGVPRRSIFIVDKGGAIRWTWMTSPEQRLPDYDAVLAEAKAVAGA